MGLSSKELIIILLIILILFGATKIPQLARGLGKGLSEFKKGASGEAEEEQKDGEKKEQKGVEQKKSDVNIN